MAMQAATKFHKRSGLTNVSLDDVKAAAYYGLLLAAHRYDDYCDEHGYDSEDLSYFSVYCRKRINGEMIDLLRAQDWVSRTVRTRQKLIAAIQESEQFALSEAEIVERTGLTVEQVRKAQVANETQPLSVSHDLSLTEFEVAFFDDHVNDATTVSRILELTVLIWNDLSDQEKLAISYRYYLGLTLSEIAEEMEVSTSEAASLIHEVGLYFYHRFREHFYPELP